MVKQGAAGVLATPAKSNGKRRFQIFVEKSIHLNENGLILLSDGMLVR